MSRYSNRDARSRSPRGRSPREQRPHYTVGDVVRHIMHDRELLYHVDAQRRRLGMRSVEDWVYYIQSLGNLDAFIEAYILPVQGVGDATYGHRNSRRSR